MREMQIDRWTTLARRRGAASARATRSRRRSPRTGSASSERWHTNDGQYTPTDAVEFVTTHLGIDRIDGLHEHLVENYRIVGETADLRVAPGAHECLERLQDAGVRLGIVCDVGLTSSPTLRARLDGFGLLEWFDAWSFSDETGWFKPAPEAFRPVLDASGSMPPTRPTSGTTSEPTSPARRRSG